MSTGGAGVLAFAEDGYFLDTDKNWLYPKIPASLAAEFRGKIKEIYWISIGVNDNFVASWKDKADKSWSWRHTPDYPGLDQYWKDKWKDGVGWNIASLRCTLGPKGVFYINSSVGQHSAYLDGRLRAEIERRLAEGKYWDGDPQQVALGIGGAYVLVGKKGDVLWDLKGNYKALDRYLTNAATSVRTITLSPFNGDHFYVLLKGGQSKWSGKKEWNLSRRAS